MTANDPNDSRIEPSFSLGAEPPAPPFAASPAFNSPPPPPQRHQVVFTGSGSEYFRIWIVNLLLSIITLGIYSAWAKVRSQQYFHRNTLIADSSFDYHATPIAILKGRLIALVLFIAYSGLTQLFGGKGSLLAFVIAGAVVPWLLWRSLRFRLSITSYRGLRFGFGGTLAQSYKVFLLWPVLTFCTAYLLAPFTHRQIKAYQHNHSRYGNTTFSFDAKVRSFYAVYLSWLVPVLLLIVVPTVIELRTMRSGMLNKTQVTATLMMLLLWTYAVLILLAPVVIIRLRNLIWNHTSLGNHRIESAASVWRYLFIQISNYVLILVTLGLFLPFARVRRVRYLASATTLVMAGSLDDFVAGQVADGSGAAGDETADLFGIDIAL